MSKNVLFMFFLFVEKHFVFENNVFVSLFFEFFFISLVFVLNFVLFISLVFFSKKCSSHLCVFLNLFFHLACVFSQNDFRHAELWDGEEAKGGRGRMQLIHFFLLLFFVVVCCFCFVHYAIHGALKCVFSE